MRKSKNATTKKIANLPHLPGVYLFYDRVGKLLYVGKSGSLRARVQSYFRADFAVHNAAKQAMIPQIFEIKHRVTDSEIEALILEATLIKKLRPKFNRLMRDDKSYRWVAMTREPYPKVFSTHEPKINRRHKTVRHKRISIVGRKTYILRTGGLMSRSPQYIGPFTEGLALK